MLAIRAAAAGPYKISGPCFDCGEDEGLVNFTRPFTVSIAICRRCREARTGIPDRRGIIQATATIADPALVDAIVEARAIIQAKPIPRPNVFARAIVPEDERSPSIEEIRAEIDALGELDRELDLLIDAADRAAEDPPAAEELDEVEGIFAPWDDLVDDVKRD
jgi:hypothetical protein